MIPQNRNTFEYIMVMIVGITLPLINLRLELPFLSLTFSMFMILILIALNLKNLHSKIVIQIPDYIILLFLIITLSSVLYSENVSYGLNSWIKLFIMFVLYFLLKNIFINKPWIIQTIFKFSIISLSFYIIYLIWIYIFIFGESFISINTDISTEAGKNSLAFLAAFILPFLLYSFIKAINNNKYILLNTLMLLSVTVGIILIQSRTLYLISFMIFFLSVILTKIKKRTTFYIISIFLISILLSILFVPNQIISDIIFRFSSLQYILINNFASGNLGNISGYNSIQNRSELFNQGVEMFSQNPFIGSGMGSFITYGDNSGVLSHNDYILILAENGIIGFIVFITLIGSFIYIAILNYKCDEKTTPIIISLISISLYLYSINAYDHMFLWLILSIVASQNYNIKKENLTKIV